MSWIDALMRSGLPSAGTGVGLLKRALRARGIAVRVTDACLRELAADAAAAATYLYWARAS